MKSRPEKKRYIVIYYDNDNIITEYMTAPSATQAVSLLGIDPESVVEVAVVLKDWRRSNDQRRIQNTSRKTN